MPVSVIVDSLIKPGVLAPDCENSYTLFDRKITLPGNNIMQKLIWIFDYVSPYCYLQFHQLKTFCQEQELEIEYRPLLFAGLLKHWGQLGPAEIEGKRLHTFRYTLWLARKRGLPMRYPEAHPFNPLPLLRLTIALDNNPVLIEALFDLVWRQGQLPDEDNLAHIVSRFSDASLQELTGRAEVKQILANNGRSAIEKRVFGVPTCIVNDECLWGDDSLDMLLDYLAEPTLFEDEEMQRLKNLPSAAQR